MKSPNEVAKAERLSDPIAWARHYWHANDLGDGEEAFAAMASVMRFSRMMMVQIEDALKVVDLNVTDYLMLMTLKLSEDGTRLISQLARNLLIHPTTATLATDRLENRGLLERRPHPTDRRATLVSLTAVGQEVVGRATDALHEVQFGFDGSSEKDIQRTIKLMTDLRAESTPR